MLVSLFRVTPNVIILDCSDECTLTEWIYQRNGHPGKDFLISMSSHVNVYIEVSSLAASTVVTQ